MSFRRTFVAVGSNIDPERNIFRAMKLLAERVQVDCVSTFYRTRPLRNADQPDFLNGVVCVLWDQKPERLKYDVLRPIEAALGRTRTEDAYDPRTIDLDIIYVDGVARNDDPRLPSGEIWERPFVAGPLYELEPTLVLEPTGEALETLGSVRRAAALRADMTFTDRLRSRLRHESSTCTKTD